MKIRFGLAVLLALMSARGFAQERSYFFPQFSSKAAVVEDEETNIPSPAPSLFGTNDAKRAPGGDYGLGQPLAAPQYTQGPKAGPEKGSRWWCDPCGFGGWGCGTPIRTAARNLNLQLKSLRPCGWWCQSRDCNCSGQGPYVMDWSQPDRRSCPCDCQGSHYLFPWIWNYKPSRGGCCNNHWTQRGDGYRSALQFNTPSVAAALEEVDPIPADPAEELESQTSSRLLRNVSHSTNSKKPATASIREVEPTAEEEPEVENTPVRRAPTGALSANYLARLAPPKRTEDAAAAPARTAEQPSAKTSSRRK